MRVIPVLVLLAACGGAPDDTSDSTAADRWGACTITCTPNCAAGDMRCDAGWLYTCESHPCFCHDWGDPVECPTGNCQDAATCEP